MITCPCPCYLLLSHMSLYIPRHSIRLIFMNKIYFVPNVHRVRDILNVKNILDPTMQSWLKTSILLCLLYCMWTMVYMHVGVGLLWKKSHVFVFVWFSYGPYHDDVLKWKHFPRNWPFVREIHRSPVNFPHKGQWRGALMFSLNYAWINDWVNNREAGDLRRQHGHYDVIVMIAWQPLLGLLFWYPPMLSILCRSFEDRAPVDAI